jgi:hypothetical protein
MHTLFPPQKGVDTYKNASNRLSILVNVSFSLPILSFHILTPNSTPEHLVSKASDFEGNARNLWDMKYLYRYVTQQ